MLRAFVHSFESDPSAMLGAFAPLPLAAPLRHAALVSLQAAVKARPRPLAGSSALIDPQEFASPDVLNCKHELTPSWAQ